MVKQTLSVDRVVDEYFYAVYSDDDFLNTGDDDPFLRQDYLRFCTNDSFLMYDAGNTSVPRFIASAEKIKRLSSGSPYAASMLVGGCFIGNEAFVEEFSSVASEMRAFPAQIVDSTVLVFLITSNFAIWLEDLTQSGKIRTNNYPKGYPRSRQNFVKFEDVVVSNPQVLDAGIFRVPQSVSRVYVAGDVARWLFNHRKRLGIELGIQGTIAIN